MLNAYRAGQGFAGTYEYEPIGSDISLIAMNLPEACLVSDPAVALGKPDSDGNLTWSAGQGTCLATFAVAPGSGPEHLRIHAAPAHAGYLVLRLRSYPAWQVRVDGRAASSLTPRADGLIAVPVPAGPVDVTADWTTTEDVVVSRWVSGLSVFALTGVCLLGLRRSRTRLS
jgi:hypothetical protein